MSEPETENTAEDPPAMKRVIRRRNRSGLKLLVKLAVVTAFGFGIYGSMRLGIHMAGKRTDAGEDRGAAFTENSDIVLGRAGDPVYLADTPESLRQFFSEFATPGQRASADLTGRSIRRITSPMNMTTLRAEAESVEVEITSGPIAGSVYWIHHSQMPDPSKLDPILEPVPGAVLENEEE